MDQEKQSLLQLNQETNQIIQELLQIFQRVQKNFDLMKKTIDVNKEIVEIIQKNRKKRNSIEEIIEQIFTWSAKFNEVNNSLSSYTLTLKTRSDRVQDLLSQLIINHVQNLPNQEQNTLIKD